VTPGFNPAILSHTAHTSQLSAVGTIAASRTYGTPHGLRTPNSTGLKPGVERSGMPDGIRGISNYRN